MALAARRHHPRACPPARRQPRPPRAAAASSSSSDALLSLPLLPLGPCLPTCAGRITVYEPSFKAAVALALAEAAASGKPARFIHCLAPSLAPPPFLRNGYPKIALLASVSSVEHGGAALTYTATRRVSLLDVRRAGGAPPSDRDAALVATAAYYDDDDPAPGVAGLERDLADALAATAALEAGAGRRLPAAVGVFAPPRAPTGPEATAAGLRARGHRAAAASVDVWSRGGGGGGGRADDAAPHPTLSGLPPAPSGRLATRADPYAAAAAATECGGRRAELFSFAAASALDLDPPTAAALLLSQDTQARLAFVLAAVSDHVARLRAEAALKGLGGGGA